MIKALCNNLYTVDDIIYQVSIYQEYKCDSVYIKLEALSDNVDKTTKQKHKVLLLEHIQNELKDNKIAEHMTIKRHCYACSKEMIVKNKSIKICSDNCKSIIIYLSSLIDDGEVDSEASFFIFRTLNKEYFVKSKNSKNLKDCVDFDIALKGYKAKAYLKKDNKENLELEEKADAILCFDNTTTLYIYDYKEDDDFILNRQAFCTPYQIGYFMLKVLSNLIKE